MFVMKNSMPIAVSVTESGYLELVQVDKNGVGVCKEAPTRDYLFSIGYDEIGQINQIEDLPKFLDSLKDPKVTQQAPTVEERTKVVSLREILNKPVDVKASKYWWQKTSPEKAGI